MNAKLAVYHTTSARLNQLEVQNGQIIFVEDTKNIYLDMDNRRVQYNNFTTFETDEERNSLSGSGDGLYFVEETNALWLLDDGHWLRINPEPEIPPSNVIFEEDGVWPDGGLRQNVLYVEDRGIYRYAEDGTYYPVPGHQEWNLL